MYHFHDTGKNSPFNNLSHQENDRYFLYERGENLGAFLFHISLNHVIHYRRIIKVIQSIAPFFSDFYFNPNSEGYLRLQWRSKFSSFIYGVNDLSDGTLRFIALCALFLQPQLPQVLIIDEPELGLHPTAITKLAGMIKSVAEKGTKVIAATQSSDLVNQFLPEDILTIDLVEGSSQFGRLEQQDLQSWMDNYALGELMEEPYH